MHVTCVILKHLGVHNLLRLTGFEQLYSKKTAYVAIIYSIAMGNSVTKATSYHRIAAMIDVRLELELGSVSKDSYIRRKTWHASNIATVR